MSADIGSAWAQIAVSGCRGTPVRSLLAVEVVHGFQSEPVDTRGRVQFGTVPFCTTHPAKKAGRRDHCHPS
jgi:hypothetical protein